MALARLSCEANSAAFVGDDLVADVGGAQIAGFGQVFWFYPLVDLQSQAPADAVRITTFEALAMALSIEGRS
jgi:FMN phosphatase YigB (HAD superfamily)